MNQLSIDKIVKNALIEDIGSGDLTSRLIIPPEQQAIAVINNRQDMVVSGMKAALSAIRQVDESVKFTPLAKDGDTLPAHSQVAIMEGSALSILAAERVMLNFLMRMSGIATLTKKFVDQVKDLPVRIVDTRKTMPGLRILEKEAVRHGGGFNHRHALYDGILIKDNHIAAAGSIKDAIAITLEKVPHMIKVEIEVDTLDQLQEALQAGAHIILLDNMDTDTLKQAVELTDNFFKPEPRRVILEGSGRVDLNTVRAVALTGVDVISVGSLTHSSQSIDLGLDWSANK